MIPLVKRDANGVRDFDAHMLRRIQFVKHMRAAGMNIKILQRYVYLFDHVESIQQEQIALLKQQITIMEEKRDDIQFAIDHLKYKVNHFYDHTLKAEQELKHLEKHSDKH